MVELTSILVDYAISWICEDQSMQWISAESRYHSYIHSNTNKLPTYIGYQCTSIMRIYGVGLVTITTSSFKYTYIPGSFLHIWMLGTYSMQRPDTSLWCKEGNKFWGFYLNNMIRTCDKLVSLCSLAVSIIDKLLVTVMSNSDSLSSKLPPVE